MRGDRFFCLNRLASVPTSLDTAAMRIALFAVTITIACCTGCEKRIREASRERPIAAPIVVAAEAEARHAG